MSQAPTAMPEWPTVWLAIETDEALVLERTIHGVLRLRDRWSEDAPGSEWFTTSPDEVESIYSWIRAGESETPPPESVRKTRRWTDTA